MYSSLVQFEEGPQEHVLEDNQDLLNPTPTLNYSVTPPNITTRQGSRIPQHHFLGRVSEGPSIAELCRLLLRHLVGPGCHSRALVPLSTRRLVPVPHLMFL